MKRFENAIVNIFQTMKIRTRIIIFLIIFTIIPAVILFVITNTGLHKINVTYIKNYVNASQQMTEKNLTKYIARINSSYLGVLGSDDFFHQLQKLYSGEDVMVEINELLDQLVTEYISDIDIIGENRSIYKCRKQNDVHFDAGLDISEENNWKKRVLDDDGNYYYILCKKLINVHSQKNMGYIIFYLPETGISDTFDYVKSGDDVYLVDGNNQIVSCADKRRIGNISVYDSKSKFYPVSFDHERYYVAMHTMQNSEYDFPADWILTEVISTKPTDDLLYYLRKYLIILIALIILIVPILSIWLSKQAIYSISSLQKEMRDFNMGTIKKKRRKSKKENEIAILESNFDDMIGRIQDLIEKNNIEKEKQRVAELNALQAQINPHFVYNTLDSISWMAKKEKQTDIVNMVYALSNFFRISLHDGDKYITVEKEIEHVKSYLNVEQIRFNDKFDAEFDIETGIEEEKMLKILLQPIVENAIKHGIRPKKGKSIIQISVWSENEFIFFRVADNGVGYDIENPPKRIGNGGYGLKNVIERIKMEYGQDCGVEIVSAEGEGTMVTITIKKMKQG